MRRDAGIVLDHQNKDMLIFEGLVGADESGKGGPNDPIEASLARIRQLSTHEIGHSIGLQHNF